MFPHGNKKYEKIRFLLTGIVLLMVVLPVIASAYSNESVSLGSTVVNPGTSFTLPLFIDNATNIRSMSIDIVFDNSSLIIDDIVANDSLSGSQLTHYLNNSTGFANMTLESVDITTEDPTHIADILFRAIKSGYYNIILRNVSLENDTLSFPAQFVSNGSVRINHPPQIGDIADKVINVGSEFSFVVPATDADDTVLNYDVEGLPAGYVLNFTTGLFTWTPTTVDAGRHVVNFSVSDGFATNFTYANITVNEVITDQAPEFEAIGNKFVNENAVLSFNINANDPDGDIVTYSASSLPDDSSLDANTGDFLWITDFNDGGTYPVVFTASSNNLSDSESITITVEDVNRAPILSSIGDRSVSENSELTISLSATDLDGDSIVYSTDASFGTLSDNIFSWTPTSSGIFDVEFSVSDGNDFDSEIITITVIDSNHAPVLSSIGDRVVDEGSALSFTIFGTDIDSDALEYSAADLPTGATLDVDTGEFTWTPDYDDSGIYSVTFTVSDSSLSDSETINISVDNVNRAPELLLIGDKIIDEGSELSFTISAIDPDSDTLEYSVADLPTGATLDVDTGEFTWTPDYDDSGIYSVTFTVSDSSLSDSETINITVDNVNRAPVFSSIGDKVVDEGSALSFTISATDPDSDTLEYSVTGLPSGAIFDENSLEFSWTPDFDDSGIYSVTFIVNDGFLSDSETLSISVGSVNRAPELNTIGNKQVDENSELTFSVSAIDPDYDTLVYSATNISQGSGVTFDTNTHEFSWIPDYEESGIYSFTFTVSDGSLSDSETIIITVNDVNRAPVLSSIGDKIIDEGSTLSFTISGNDLDSDELSCYSTGLPQGAIFDVNTHEFSWTPAYDDSGIYSVTFTVSDGSLSDSETITITVDNVNRIPVLSSIGDRVVDEGSDLSFTISGNDLDSDALTYSVNNLPSGASFNVDTREFSWTPTYDDSGIYSVTFAVSDGSLSDYETIIITVNDVNRAPFIESIPDQLVAENEELVIIINAIDDDGDSLSFSKNVAFGTLSGNVFSWTPGYDESGLYDVDFSVSDGDLSYTETVRIAVGNTNVPPVLDLIGGKTINEDQTLSFTISASDADSGDTLGYSASGLPAGSSFNPATREFFWIPSYDQEGTYNVIFEVTDSIFTDTELVTIIVNNVNRAPVLSNIGDKTVDEGSELRLQISGTDPDQTALVYSATGLPSGSNFNAITHEFVWIPDFDDSGTYSVIFTVNDGVESDSETISITVDNVNRAPVLNAIGNKAVAEASELRFTISANDLDSDRLSYSATGLPPGSNFDVNTHEFTWTPDFDDSGAYSITFTVSDGSLLDSETISVSVGSVNRAPELDTIADMSVSEGSELSFPIFANDPDLDSLTYSATGLPSGSNFDVDTHEFAWTPDFDDSGTYSITFIVSDGLLSDSETISITVNDINRAPVLGEIGNKSIAEGFKLSFTILGTDPDLDSLTYSVVDLPSGASFNEGSRLFSWTPDYDDSGTYSVSFTVSDGSLSDSETITLSVGSVNRAPELNMIGNKQVDENLELNFSVSAIDPDSDTLIYSVANIPSDSGATFNTNTGQFLWKPDFEESGIYSFTFTVSDGSLSDSETIIVTVNDVNRAPVIDSIGNKAVSEGSELFFTVSGSDADSNQLFYSATGLPSDAYFNVNTHVFTWTPDFEESGTYNVTFTVSDGFLSDSETISISVGSVNRAPVLSNIGDKTISENTELHFTVSASDPDADSLVYSVGDLPPGASFNSTDHKFVWTPGYDDSGEYNVTFTVNDDSLSDSETISITVLHVNLPPRLAVIGDQSTDENSFLTFTLDAEDDDADTLYYSATSLPSGAHIDGSTGIFTWTPTYEQAGNHHIQFVVSDGLVEDTENVEVIVNNINRAPSLNPPESVQIAENSNLIINLNDSDPDGDILVYSKDVEFGTLHNGIFSWTPGYEDEGSYHITFTVSDGEFDVSKTVHIDVGNTNSAPVLYSISDTLVNELETVTIVLQAIDIDGDELTFSKDVNYGTLSGNTFTWVPGINESGFHEIQFTVSDGQLSDSKTATIAVGNTNIPPVIMHMETQQATENEFISFVLNASDVDGDKLTYSDSGLPTGASFGKTTGEFSWTPTYDQAGSYTVEFSVSDKIYTSVETVIINVANVNRAPVFDYIPIHTVNETEILKINLSARDPDDDWVFFSCAAENGTVTGNIYSWTPGYFDSGDHYIDFNVTDGDLTDTTTVHVEVYQTNIPPEIENFGPFSLYENATLNFYVNATDVDNDQLTYSASGLPAGASFDVSTRQFHWRPDYTQSGTYSVEFWVTDGKLNASKAVSISVYNVNRDSTTDLSGFSTSDSSGGSGGGGSASGAEDYDNVAYKDYGMKYVTQGAEIVFEFPNAENDLEYVKFNSLKAAGQVKAIIEILYDRSSLVSSNPQGDVYRHINIWLGDAKFNSGGYMSSAEISFRVEKKWITDNNADPSAIKLCRYSSGSWKELTTSRIGTDVNYYYYKAQTPGFSPFSIVSTGNSPVLRSTALESTAQNVKYSYGSESTQNSITSRSESEALNTALEHDPVSPVNTGIFFIGIIGILAIGSAIGYRSRNESVVLSRYYEALHSFSTGIINAAEWMKHKLSSESMHNDYAVLSGKLTEMKTADYKAIYEKTIAEIKERQKQ